MKAEIVPVEKIQVGDTVLSDGRGRKVEGVSQYGGDNTVKLSFSPDPSEFYSDVMVYPQGFKVARTSAQTSTVPAFDAKPGEVYTIDGTAMVVQDIVQVTDNVVRITFQTPDSTHGRIRRYTRGQVLTKINENVNNSDDFVKLEKALKEAKLDIKSLSENLDALHARNNTLQRTLKHLRALINEAL